MALTEPIRDPAKVKELLAYYRDLRHFRNQLIITLAIHTALRISDILRLKCDDVYDFTNRRVRRHITITEQKTGKSKIIALHKNVIHALEAYFAQASPGMPLILNEKTGNAISRVHAYRIINAAADAIDIPHNVGCHSLRKTFGYHAWQNGTSPVVIMDIYNHSNFHITQRYIGITQDDKNTAYLELSFLTKSQ